MTISHSKSALAVLGRVGGPVATRRQPSPMRHLLPVSELVALCQAIETSLQNDPAPGRLVQFASAYAGEGRTTIALEAGFVAATTLGKSVLFIDASAMPSSAVRQLLGAKPVPLDRVAMGQADLPKALVHVEETALCLAVLRGADQGSPPDPGLLRSLFGGLKECFDLIIIDSGPILTDVIAIPMARLSDGVVLVVEAERTRHPVALKARDAVVSGGGRVLGVALSKRRYHIPHWLYRLLWA